MDSEDDDLLLAEREFESLRNHSMKDGFREGRAAGLEKSRQEEFSRGYGDGFSAGVPWGRSLGELSALQTSAQVKPEELAQICEEIEKTKSEHLLKLSSKSSSHPHEIPLDTISDETASSVPSLPPSFATISSHIDRLKTRLLESQGGGSHSH